MSGDDDVSAAELGRVIGQGERWVRKLESQGILRKSGRGRYPLAACVQAYIAHIRETELEAQVAKLSAKEQYEAERARKMRLANDKEERLLVPIADAAAAIDYMFGEVRNDLAGVAARVTDDVGERRRIEDAIDAVLTALDERFDKAGADLEAGRDPFAPVDEVSA